MLHTLGLDERWSERIDGIRTVKPVQVDSGDASLLGEAPVEQGVDDLDGSAVDGGQRLRLYERTVPVEGRSANEQQACVTSHTISATPRLWHHAMASVVIMPSPRTSRRRSWPAAAWFRLMRRWRRWSPSPSAQTSWPRLTRRLTPTPSSTTVSPTSSSAYVAASCCCPLERSSAVSGITSATSAEGRFISSPES